MTQGSEGAVISLTNANPIDTCTVSRGISSAIATRETASMPLANAQPLSPDLGSVGVPPTSLQLAAGVGDLLAIAKITISKAIYYPAYQGNSNLAARNTPTFSFATAFEYDPFGNTLAATGPYAAADEYRFSTQPQDRIGGLYYYYGYRCYEGSFNQRVFHRFLSGLVKDAGGRKLHVIMDHLRVHHGKVTRR